jgi:hypothetical protein
MISGSPLYCGKRTPKATVQQRGATQFLPPAGFQNQCRNFLATLRRSEVSFKIFKRGAGKGGEDQFDQSYDK